MDGQHVLFEFFWIKWTVPLIAGALCGAITAIATLYKIYERWSTREQRRLDMLHIYLDREERDISAKRAEVFAGIQQARNADLLGKRFDVGEEIDEAIRLLDSGKPDRAAGRLAELDKKLEANASMLERRAADLRKHKASVQVFLAALADVSDKPKLGLDYITNALQVDTRDPDALKYQGLLHLKQGVLDEAERSFDRLRQYSNGDENAHYRADAHLGLATVHIARGVDHFDQAFQSLTTAMGNLARVPPSAQDRLVKAYIHQQFGVILSDEKWGAPTTSLRPDSTLSEHWKSCAKFQIDEVWPSSALSKSLKLLQGYSNCLVHWRETTKNLSRAPMAQAVNEAKLALAKLAR